MKIWHPEKSVILTDDIGEDSTIHAPVWIGKDVHIGKACRVQAFSFIPEGAQIEDFVFIGPNVTFTNDKHPPSQEWQKTFVGMGASIGAGTVILPGVTIGEFAVIGAGSVVTKDVPPKEMWFGNPARFVKCLS